MYNYLKIIKERDPAARSFLHIILFSAGFHAVIFYRLSRIFYRLKVPLLPYFVMYISKIITGVEIHPAAVIGKKFFIDHGIGVVIGETTEIGDDVTIYQGVTLGGTGKECGKRHPTIGNNVVIGAGAKILGSFTIGNNVNIGANAVVLKNIPDDSTVVGIPGRIVKMNGERLRQTIFELDHMHLPDPLMNVVKSLEDELHTFEHRCKNCRDECQKLREKEKLRG